MTSALLILSFVLILCIMLTKVSSRLETEAHSKLKLTMDLSKVHLFDKETELRID